MMQEKTRKQQDKLRDINKTTEENKKPDHIVIVDGEEEMDITLSVALTSSHGTASAMVSTAGAVTALNSDNKSFIKNVIMDMYYTLN